MAEYIKRSKADAYTVRLTELTDDCIKKIALEVAKELRTDVTPVKRGKWIDECVVTRCDSIQWCLICSECGMFTFTRNMYDYCPHCGARMDEEE